MEIIDMEVKHVELGDARAHFVEHQHVIRNYIANGAVELQRLRAARHEIGSGDGITTCEQSHLMALCDEIFGQVGDHAFRSSIEARRNTFH